MRVLVHEEAGAELEAAAIWYEEHRTDLGQDLLADAARAIELIEQSPETWPPWLKVPHRGVRQFLLTRFPIESSTSSGARTPWSSPSHTRAATRRIGWAVCDRVDRDDSAAAAI